VNEYFAEDNRLYKMLRDFNMRHALYSVLTVYEVNSIVHPPFCKAIVTGSEKNFHGSNAGVLEQIARLLLPKAQLGYNNRRNVIDRNIRDIFTYSTAIMIQLRKFIRLQSCFSICLNIYRINNVPPIKKHGKEQICRNNSPIPVFPISNPPCTSFDAA
jgi:hypothetical protein